MSYKTPTYKKINNDKTVSYITPNAAIIVAIAAVIFLTQPAY